MAHIHDLEPQVSVYNYSGGRLSSNQLTFPKTQIFQGYHAPSRLEGDVVDLEVDGVVPPEINGTFFRIQPDHRYPPMFEDDINFNGDGAVTAIRIQNGHVDFKQRYVRTDRFHSESEARRALFGRCKWTKILVSQIMV